MDKNGRIENLNYLRSSGGAAGVPKVEVTIVQQVAKGPLPELLEPVVLVDNKVPVPEVRIALAIQRVITNKFFQKEKSFLQKYGLYLAPLLILFLMSGGN